MAPADTVLCVPWNVSDLPAHVRAVIAWLPGMPAVPAPTRAEVPVVAYYRPRRPFRSDANATWRHHVGPRAG
ncbi:hypothetical protein GCM10010448_48270 [Streptomyces glomeratus]|uniref:Uncharacterized protein n=1 Tax=Streptomyces glomeratus TaxID=284452 RepID=A0ABP6LVG6_9ACTN